MWSNNYRQLFMIENISLLFLGPLDILQMARRLNLLWYHRERSWTISISYMVMQR